MKHLSFFISVFILCHSLKSQNIPNPYASIGKPMPKMATVTNGQYQEFFIEDSLVQIGTTVMNRRTGKVAYFQEDSPIAYAELTKRKEKSFRWMSPDPQFKRYAYSSPYTGFGNNPIYYVDHSGQTLEVAGDETARMQAQVALQKLTNDKVEVLANGTVVLTASNENPSKNLTFGTQLLRAIVTNQKTSTINIVQTANKTISNAEDEQKANPTNASIEWNPDNPEGGLDENGSRIRPAFIGLAHELIHGLFAMLGKATDDENLVFSDPDQNEQDAGFGVNEKNTRMAENEIRKEQGLTQRKTPQVINIGTGESLDKNKIIPTPIPQGGKINAPVKN